MPARRSRSPKRRGSLRETEARKKRAETGPESAGQSGDQQGLPLRAVAADESVAELAAEEQPYEASIVDGVEESADEPEREVHVRSLGTPSHIDEVDAVVFSVEEATNETEGDDARQNYNSD